MPAPPPAKRPPLKAVPDTPPDTSAATDAAVTQANAALDALAAAEPAFRAAVEGLATADRLEELLALLGRLSDAKDLVADYIRRAGDAAVEIVPSTREKYPVPGGGTFRVSQASPKKRIDGAGVKAATAQAIADTLNLEAVVLPSGEMGDPLPVIRQIVETVVAVSGASGEKFDGWRVTPLKELGVTLSKFTDYEDAPLKPVLEDRTP